MVGVPTRGGVEVGVPPALPNTHDTQQERDSEEVMTH